MAEAAADYLNRGLRVIALNGKTPNGRVHRNGLHSAIAGPVENDADWQLLAEAFEHPDTTGVGIVIDYPYVVVDIDGEDGAQQWDQLVGSDSAGGRWGGITWTARTGRGLHLWYACDLPTGTIKLGPKLDLKGAGGYVAAPPSRHPDGHIYEWLVAPGDPPVEVPEALRAIIEQRRALAEHRVKGAAGRKPIRGPRYTEGATKFYAQSGFDGLFEGMRNAVEGNRNQFLHWAAATMAEEGAEEEDFMQLHQTAIEAGLEHEETRRTIRSGRRSQ